MAARGRPPDRTATGHARRRAAGGRRGLQLADALGHAVHDGYLCADDAEGTWRLEYRFLELDRATVPSERLAAKLARYARLYRFRPRAERPPPAWQARYPVFPALLVVFAGQPRESSSAAAP